jgi:hypothetical protein
MQEECNCTVKTQGEEIFRKTTEECHETVMDHVAQ